MFFIKQQSNYSMTSSLPSKITLIYMILCYSWSWTLGFREKQEFPSKRWNEDLGTQPKVWDYPEVISAQSHGLTQLSNLVTRHLFHSFGPSHTWLLSQVIAQKIRVETFSWSKPHPTEHLLCGLRLCWGSRSAVLESWMRDGWKEHRPWHPSAEFHKHSFCF